MSTYRLIALDMDGTVLDNDQRVSRENQKWIERALDAGIHVCFCTGRGVHSVLPYVEELNLHTPLITVNGGEIWEKPHHLWTRHELSLAWVERLYALAKEYDIWYWAYSVSGPWNHEHWPADLAKEQWLKFGFHTEDDKLRQAVYKTVKAWDVFEITNSSPLNLELNPRGVSKSSGLQEVCAKLGITMDTVVAVGDSLNDLSMIRDAGWGVAMGNAQQPVKDVADWITDTNAQDGVAKVIRRVLLDR